MPIRQLAIITYTRRFHEALRLLCTETPPLELCVAWLESDDDRLQEWVLEHTKTDWATGIGTIDSAHFMADQVEEGRAEIVAHGVERVMRHLQREPIDVSWRQGRWVADACPANLRQDDIRQTVNDGLALLSDRGKGKATLRISSQYSLTESRERPVCFL
tara:strand:+ start:1591 stop:2070 length:480 start_codon:yes stop_codon:yes gene_type:complete